MATSMPKRLAMALRPLIGKVSTRLSRSWGQPLALDGRKRPF